MKIAGRYKWGKTRRGYGYRPYKGCGLSIEKHGQTENYGIYNRYGELFATCADYRSAQRVVACLRRAELAWFEERRYQDFLVLEDTGSGYTLHTYEGCPGYQQEHFPTLEAAEAHIRGAEHIFKDGKYAGRAGEA